GGLLTRGDRFDPRGCRPRRSAARRPARHAGLPRPRSRRVPLPHFPDAPSTALRAHPKVGRGLALRDEPGRGRHGPLDLRVAATSAPDAPAHGGRTDTAHLARALERAPSSRAAPHLNPPFSATRTESDLGGSYVAFARGGGGCRRRRIEFRSHHEYRPRARTARRRPIYVRGRL